jgi:hypothetical protein
MYDVIFVLLALLSLIFGLSVSKDIATLDKADFSLCNLDFLIIDGLLIRYLRNPFAISKYRRQLILN